MIDALAYITGLTYPHVAANALQTLHMAAAFAGQVGQVGLFVRDLHMNRAEMAAHYGVDLGALRVEALQTSRWRLGRSRDHWYHALIGVRLLAGYRGRQLIIIVRHPRQFIAWGNRANYPHVRGWMRVYEAHDLSADGQLGDSAGYDPNASYVQTRAALTAYDHVIAVTRGLADDITALTDGRVQPEVVPLSSGLPRLDHAPTIIFDPERVLIGYVGTIDPAHGLDDAFAGLLRLPASFRLRIVGRVKDADRAWLDSWATVLGSRLEICAPVGYGDVANVIDACDLVIAPAGATLHSERYRSPLKLFDYMARGKPIIAARVPAHEELLRADQDVLFYTAGDPLDWAAQIRALVEQPARAESIARQAWARSIDHTYDARAARILTLIAAREG